MAGLSSLLREALHDLAVRGERNGARTLARRLGPDDAPAPMMFMHIGGDRFGQRAKPVSWDVDLPVGPQEADIVGNQSALQRLIHRHYDRRAAENIEPGTPDAELDPLLRKMDALNEAQRQAAQSEGGGWNRKAALPAFRAARQALLDDMAARSPFEPWTPNAGYEFWGLTPTHEKIYERMVSAVKHPDYFVQTAYNPEMERRIFYLRRRFPLRHEVAAGAGLGVLGYASNAGDGE